MTVTGGTNIYALGKKGGTVGFYRVSSEVTIPAGKAYLNTAAGVKEFLSFDFDGETAISEIANGKSYDLQGRPATKQSGIIIKNGKKIIQR